MADERQGTVTIQSLLESGAITGHKDGNYGSQYPRVEEFGPVGVPFLTAKSLNDGKVDIDGAPRLANDKADVLRFGFVQPGDVLLSHNATVGRVAIVPEVAGRVLIGTSLTYFRVDPSKILPRYLAAYFSGSDFQSQLAAVMSQTTRNQVPITAQRRLRIVLPALAEQRAIAHILGTLNDKIELNQRMSESLEAMTRSLFKSWFVDFDPVCAKAEGLDSGLPKPLSDLFPATLQDSPIGPVPKGWKVERFDAHITAARGLSYNGEGLRNDRTGLPMHNLNSIYEGGGYKHEGIKYYAGEYRDKHLLKPGDMIVTNTEQGFDHLLIGHAAIVPRCYGETGLYSHHIYRVRHTPSSPFSAHYLVELFNNRRWHHWISGFSNGTTINMLPIDALQMPLLVVPPIELVEKFTPLAEAAHLHVEENTAQTLTLGALRDTLLPKLISGELRVSDGARIAAEAGA